MYCENCGKEISDQAKVCPYCGQTTASAAGSSGGSSFSMSSGSLQNKTVAGMSIFRFALCVFGALHVLAFFFMSYAKLSGGGLLLSGLLPKKMTAMSYISFTFDMADMGLADTPTLILNTVVCLLPVLLGLLIVKNALTGKDKKSYRRSLILASIFAAITVIVAILALLVYMLLGAAMSGCEDAGYKLTSGAVLGCLLSVLTGAAAVAGSMMDPSIQQ